MMKIQILELQKLPKEAEAEADIFHWMRFLGGKTREEFEDMAKKDEYIGLAYEELERMSADIQAKMEYEARRSYEVSGSNCGRGRASRSDGW